VVRRVSLPIVNSFVKTEAAYSSIVICDHSVCCFVLKIEFSICARSVSGEAFYTATDDQLQ